MKKVKEKPKMRKSQITTNIFLLFTCLYRKNHILFENIIEKTKFILINLCHNFFALQGIGNAVKHQCPYRYAL